MNEEKPKKLYRGIVLELEELKKANILGVDMYPPHLPKINKEGRQVVDDGNEYGVYMTDYERMVRDAYGNPQSRGSSLSNTVSIGTDQSRIKVPSVGITYEIDTDGVEIRRPWISSQLQGVYNNGYEGNEWIADFIPANKYHITRTVIARDILHDEEIINPNYTPNIKQFLIDKVESRKKRLEAFLEDMSKLDFSQRRTIGRDVLDGLKLIYGENGSKYLSKDQIDTSTPEGIMKYILRENSDKNNGELDYSFVREISRIWGRFSCSLTEPHTTDILKNIFEKELQKKYESREAFIEKAKQKGADYETSFFDNKITMYSSIVGTIEKLSKRNELMKQSKEGSDFDR